MRGGSPLINANQHFSGTQCVQNEEDRASSHPRASRKNDLSENPLEEGSAYCNGVGLRRPGMRGGLASFLNRSAAAGVLARRRRPETALSRRCRAGRREEVVGVGREGGWGVGAGEEDRWSGRERKSLAEIQLQLLILQTSSIMQVSVSQQWVRIA